MKYVTHLYTVTHAEVGLCNLGILPDLGLVQVEILEMVLFRDFAPLQHKYLVLCYVEYFSGSFHNLAGVTPRSGGLLCGASYF
jgi:hypothetical protein